MLLKKEEIIRKINIEKSNIASYKHQIGRKQNQMSELDYLRQRFKSENDTFSDIFSNRKNTLKKVDTATTGYRYYKVFRGYVEDVNKTIGARYLVTKTVLNNTIERINGQRISIQTEISALKVKIRLANQRIAEYEALLNILKSN